MRALVAAALLLAGCAGEALLDEETPFDPETGILRGVVVDDTIVPLRGAQVLVRAGAVAHDATTDADGRFELHGLPPALYVVEVHAAGHFPLETTTVVQAGVRDPDVLRIVLQRNDREVAFHLQHVWEGRLACATTGANWCALPHLYAGINPASDDSVRFFWNEFMDPGRMPTHVSIDLAWASTQTVTPELLQRITASDPDMIALGSWNHTFISFEGGASPVHFDIDEEAIQGARLGLSMGLNIETFVPTPGIAVDQEFTEFLTVFYGYTPPAGWRLPDDPQVPPP